MAFGLLSTGPSIKSYDEILDSVKAKIKSKVGFAVNTLPWSVTGSILRIVADEVTLLWQFGESIVYANTIDSSGVQLDRAVEELGIARFDQKKSTAKATLTGTAGTQIPAGRIITNTTNSTKWTTVESATIGGGGTISDVSVESVLYGEISASTGDSWNIETPIFGWTGFALDADATEGRLRETDSELRERALDLDIRGNSSLEGIVAEVAKLANVNSVAARENDTAYTDEDGRPPHSFEIYVDGGADQDIGNTIWQYKPAGNKAHGTESVNVTSSWGYIFVVKFSRPSATTVWVEITGTKDVLYSGDSAVESAVLEYADDLVMGEDVQYLSIVKRILDNVQGILTLDVALGLTNGGETSDTNIAISDTALASITLANIDVTIT